MPVVASLVVLASAAVFQSPVSWDSRPSVTFVSPLVLTQAGPSAIWTELSAQPPGKVGLSFAYASAWNRFIVFGGATGSPQVTNDTWFFALASRTWWNLTRTVAPSPRTAAAMAYDSRAERVVLFGGFTINGLANDTWAYDWATNMWTDLSPPAGPPPRERAAMVYDAVADRLVLFGGLASSGLPLGDTWSYDYSANAWSLIGTNSPGPRFAPSLTFDSVADQTILFGGADFNGTGIAWKNDTWSFSLSSQVWTEAVSASGPSVRGGAALAYDSGANVALLFGGADTTVAYNDTWAFNSTSSTWSNITPSRSPSSRANGGFAYDEGAGRFVLYAGGPPASAPLDDVWTLEYVTPTPYTPSSPRNLQATARSGAVSLSWQPPATNGSAPVTNYEIYRGPGPEGERYMTTVGNVLNYVDLAVQNYVGYVYQVAARSSAGAGPRSNEVFASPLPPRSPDAPRNLAATGGPGEVYLTWLPPAFDGGALVTAYHVYVQVNGGHPASLALIGNVTAYTDSGLESGLFRVYQVSAVNLEGEGPMSNTASASPTPAPDRTPPTISIASPANHTEFTDPLVRLFGTSTDNVEVESVAISRDRMTWTTAEGTTLWSANLTLAAGSNTIYSRATDRAGNNATTWIVLVLHEPATPPPATETPNTPPFVGPVAVVLALGVLAFVILFRLRKLKPTDHRRGRP